MCLHVAMLRGVGRGVNGDLTYWSIPFGNNLVGLGGLLSPSSRADLDLTKRLPRKMTQGRVDTTESTTAG